MIPSTRLRDGRGKIPRQAIVALLALHGCLLAGGCGRHSVEMVAVKGHVTYGGGPWPRPGVLFLAPVEAAHGQPLRPASADFDTDGNFSVGSFRNGDGVVPGRYMVAISCWEIRPSPPVKPGRNCVSAEYQDPKTSGIEVQVPTDSRTVELNFDVPKPTH